MSDLKSVTTPTTYTVSCLPVDDVESRHFDLTVQHRGGGRWTVQHGAGTNLAADGTWSHSVPSYDRSDDWLDRHRFDLDTALHLAEQAAPHITVNGYTVADALAAYHQRAASLSRSRQRNAKQPH